MVQTTGFTIWLTGMRGAGKSTLAAYLGGRFQAIGRLAEILDHDELASALLDSTGDTKEEKDVSVSRLGLIAKLLTRNNCVAIAAAVSPHRDIRDKIRREIARFVEVYVDCPTEKLIERDTEGLYKKALAGDLPNFTGVTEPYDTPQHAEVTVHTDQEAVEASAEKIVQSLVSIGYLTPDEGKLMTGKRIRPATSPKPKRPKARAPEKSKRRAPAAKARRSAPKARRSAPKARRPAPKARRATPKARRAKREASRKSAKRARRA